VDTLGERLCSSLLVMSNSSAPIYPSESKSVLKYSRRNKIDKLDKHLLAETLETFSVSKDPSRLLCGVASKHLSVPAKDAIVSKPVQDEGYQPLLRRGFLLPSSATPPSEVDDDPLSSVQSTLGSPPLLSILEEGEPSQGGGLEEFDGPPGEAIDLNFCIQTLGVSHKGKVKAFLDFMALIDDEHR
jgi:hypothetical protein